MDISNVSLDIFIRSIYGDEGDMDTFHENNTFIVYDGEEWRVRTLEQYDPSDKINIYFQDGKYVSHISRYPLDIHVLEDRYIIISMNEKVILSPISGVITLYPDYQWRYELARNMEELIYIMMYNPQNRRDIINISIFYTESSNLFVSHKDGTICTYYNRCDYCIDINLNDIPILYLPYEYVEQYGISDISAKEYMDSIIEKYTCVSDKVTTFGIDMIPKHVKYVNIDNIKDDIPWICQELDMLIKMYPNIVFHVRDRIYEYVYERDSLSLEYLKQENIIYTIKTGTILYSIYSILSLKEIYIADMNRLYTLDSTHLIKHLESYIESNEIPTIYNGKISGYTDEMLYPSVFKVYVQYSFDGIYHIYKDPPRIYPRCHYLYHRTNDMSEFTQVYTIYTGRIGTCIEYLPERVSMLMEIPQQYRDITIYPI